MRASDISVMTTVFRDPHKFIEGRLYVPARHAFRYIKHFYYFPLRNNLCPMKSFHTKVKIPKATSTPFPSKSKHV